MKNILYLVFIAALLFTVSPVFAQGEETDEIATDEHSHEDFNEDCQGCVIIEDECTIIDETAQEEKNDGTDHAGCDNDRFYIGKEC